MKRCNMKDIISCKYMEKYTERHDNNNGIKIIQTLSENGEIIIENKSYPIEFGSLYFIDCFQKYAVIPEEKDTYCQNIIVISREFLNNLAELLDFTREAGEIFKNGYFLPVKHHKIIDDHFKKMSSVYNSEKAFSKALFTAKFLELLNYAVSSL